MSKRRLNGSPNKPLLPWASTTDQVVKHLGTDTNTGLTSAQVQTLREQYGYNELIKPPGKPLWKLVLEQFDDMLVKILLLAAIISFVLAYFEGVEGDAEAGLRAYIEPFVILLILVLNAVVGVWQESNAEAALEALKELQTETASVISDLPAKDLVPGDVVQLHMGDKVPADLRLLALKTAIIRVEQSSLTGEAVPVAKQPNVVVPDDIELQGKENMLFAGTSIAYGSCVGIVTAIGMNTELGKIHAQIQEASEFEEDTPLKQKLNEFGELLAQVIFYICVTVWLINYQHFLSWKTYPGTLLPDPSTITFSLSKCTYYFKIAVALAVAAIPEGLPAVITTCLALGTRQMAKKNAIVRKLPSVETLGCTTVICSDKTGTLTTNQMSAVKLVAVGATPGSLRLFEVDGHTFNPDEGGVVGLKTLDANLQAIAEVCAVCNEANIEVREGRFKAVGNPTEAALLVLAEKLGVPDAQLQAQIQETRRALVETHGDDVDGDDEDGPLVTGQASYILNHGSTGMVPSGACAYYKQRFPKHETLEFDRERKSMSVLCANNNQGAAGNRLLVKGAAECVLQRCSMVKVSSGAVKPLDAGARKKIEAQIESMAGQALRCLALAYKDDLAALSTYNGERHAAHTQLTNPSNYESIESNLIFVGLAGLEDPPRPEVPGAIAECQAAGIRVMVITGDNKLTAEAICGKIGVFEDGVDVDQVSMTGRQFMDLPDTQRRAFLEGSGGRCFSRAEPRHKLEIVRLLKDMGEVAAMTGDGVNDAPALKTADIGIAMGITGTEVAKEASDMVLADDNFSSIVAAVQAGRAIFNNMKAFIRYMISSNIGEVVSIFLTAALGLPEGLIPVQLLWVNLVTDGPPATALGFNPPDPDIMMKKPRRKDDALVSAWIFFRWMVVGLYVGAATVGVFCAWYLSNNFLGINLGADGHTPVTWKQLSDWETCAVGAPGWEGFQPSPYTVHGGDLVEWKNPCDYFREGKVKASTLSLTVLVLIEMFNALNALSEDNSLLQMPPHRNPWLLVAMFVSVGLHVLIMYVPVFNGIFSIVPLSRHEWLLVLAFAAPVMLIDELLKALGRWVVNRESGGRVVKTKLE